MSKRLVDVTTSFFGLVFLTPILCLMALWIRFDSPGPIFFQQERIGRAGKRFAILKFRTMVVDAERLGGVLTIGADLRLTRSGRFLSLRYDL